VRDLRKSNKLLDEKQKKGSDKSNRLAKLSALRRRSN